MIDLLRFADFKDEREPGGIHLLPTNVIRQFASQLEWEDDVNGFIEGHLEPLSTRHVREIAKLVGVSSKRGDGKQAVLDKIRHRLKRR